MIENLTKRVESLTMEVAALSKKHADQTKSHDSLHKNLKETQVVMEQVKQQTTEQGRSYVAAIKNSTQNTSNIPEAGRFVRRLELQHHMKTFKLRARGVTIPRDREEQVTLVKKMLATINLKDFNIVSSFSVKEKNNGGYSIIFTVSSDMEALLIVKNRRHLNKEVRIYDQLSNEEMSRKRLVFPLHFNNERQKMISNGNGGSRNQNVWFRRDKMFVEGKEFTPPTIASTK